MTRETWIAAALVGLVGMCGVYEARAQGVVQPAASYQATAARGTQIAVVDLRKVFEHHRGFKGGMESLDRDAKAIESELNAKNQALAERSKQLKQLRVDSPDYQRIESELVRQKADLQFLARQKQKELRLREVKQYYQAYREIQAAVARVAQRYNIQLVLQYDSKPIDPANIRSVARGMSQAVVLQQNLDITQLVIDELPRAVARHQTNQTGGLPARR